MSIGPTIAAVVPRVATRLTVSGDEPDVEELQEFARERLAKFKVPKRIIFVDELPKSGTGKIQKFVLREQAEEDAEKS